MIIDNQDKMEMELNAYYQENGYIVLRNLIPAQLIDRLLELYNQQILTSKDLFFRQSTGEYEKNQINEFGHVKQSFLDIHDYKKYSEFSNVAKRIYCNELLQESLKKVTGSNVLNLMQTMLFDANTETQPHQDWWYLDTVPNGHLIAVWIALEDIDEKAGRFYVLPKSNLNPDFHSDTANLSHSQWLVRINQYLEEHCEEIVAPDMRKGDVLFWNSKTIHGALPTSDPRFSRKSLTAHYIPAEYKFGNIFTTKDNLKYKTYEGLKFYRNQPDYSLLNQLKFGIKNFAYDYPWLMRILRKVQNNPGGT